MLADCLFSLFDIDVPGPHKCTSMERRKLKRLKNGKTCFKRKMFPNQRPNIQIYLDDL